MRRGWLVAGVMFGAWGAAGAWAADVSPPRAAMELFNALNPALINVRTLVAGNEQAESYGSGFFVDALGRAVTNYHVVADHVFDPATYPLQIVTADGQKGTARVLAFDVVSDLAVIQAQAPVPGSPTAAPAPRHDFLALPGFARPLITGEPLHSLGNPLRLGATIMSGHYSSQLSSAGIERIHFSGALNPGMSGGPAVDGQGALIGVNVSRRLFSDQVSFLVPVQRVQALYRVALQGTAGDGTPSRQQIAEQLRRFQSQLRDAAFAAPWKSEAHGPYRAPEYLTDAMDCGASTNRAPDEAAPVLTDTTHCALRETIYLRDDLRSGSLSYTHSYLRSLRLNDVQFAHLLDQQAQHRLTASPSDSMARQQCRDETTRAGPQRRLPVRMLWCAQAYRDLPGLYDVALSIVTRDRPREALISRLTLEGVSWDTALQFTRRTLETIE